MSGLIFSRINKFKTIIKAFGHTREKEKKSTKYETQFNWKVYMLIQCGWINTRPITDNSCLAALSKSHLNHAEIGTQLSIKPIIIIIIVIIHLYVHIQNTHTISLTCLNTFDSTNARHKSNSWFSNAIRMSYWNCSLVCIYLDFHWHTHKKCVGRMITHISWKLRKFQVNYSPNKRYLCRDLKYILFVPFRLIRADLPGESVVYIMSYVNIIQTINSFFAYSSYFCCFFLNK